MYYDKHKDFQWLDSFKTFHRFSMYRFVNSYLNKQYMKGKCNNERREYTLPRVLQKCYHLCCKIYEHKCIVKTWDDSPNNTKNHTRMRVQHLRFPGMNSNLLLIFGSKVFYLSLSNGNILLYHFIILSEWHF